MKIEPVEMQDTKSDLEEVREALDTLSSIWEAGEAGQQNRIAFLRALADLARENTAARLIVTELLDVVGGRHSEEAATFRVYYLEGERKPSARQIARRLCMDVRTVYRYNRRILIAMLPIAFGVYGLFYPDSNQRRAAGTPEEC